MPKTPVQRKQEERQRKRAAGLVPVTSWVHKSRVDEFRAIAKAYSGQTTTDKD